MDSAQSSSFRRWWRTAHWLQKAAVLVTYAPLAALIVLLAANITLGTSINKYMAVGVLCTIVIGVLLNMRGQRLTRGSLAAANFRVCPECGYDLVGGEAAGFCPECGTQYSPESLRRDWAELLQRRL